MALCYSGGERLVLQTPAAPNPRGTQREVSECFPRTEGQEEQWSLWPEKMARRDRGSGGIPEGHRLCGCWNMGLRVPEVEPGKGVECQTQTHSQKEQYPGCRPLARKARQVARGFDPQQ